MNIGITIGLQKEYESMWVNGIKLNAILLANALMQIGKHNVYLVDTSSNVEDLTKVSWDYNKFPVRKFADAFKDTDLMITLGTSFPTETIEKFKAQGPNRRLVKYMCGNSYVIEMERSIFKTGNDLGIAPWDPGADEVWYVPQQGYQNEHYYKTIFKTDRVYPVPFVWDPMFMIRELAIYKKNDRKLPIYTTGIEQAKKRISVFEPNMNVVKYSMIPILAAEQIHRRGVEFDKMYIASGKDLLKNGYYKSMITTLDLIKDNPKEPKIQFTSRYPVCHYLAETTEIVLSHQWENPLNYSYLDVMFMGYPLIHNADMIQDAGYYYPDFNIEKAADKLEWVLKNHDDNREEYAAKNKVVLDRYTIKNEALVDTYDKLIENLYDGKNEMSMEYNWKTNLYK
tara:strand:+ start:1346 stop:2536 length:1191 start_codon:yes stop_codon:yes gene_type:complete